MKHLGINLTKEVKDLYIENFKPLKKKLEKHTGKWRHLMLMGFYNEHCTKNFYQFKEMPLKTSTPFFTVLDKTTPKIIWNHKRSQITPAILSKKNIARRITIPHLEIYYRDIITKTIWSL